MASIRRNPILICILSVIFIAETTAFVVFASYGMRFLVPLILWLVTTIILVFSYLWDFDRRLKRVQNNSAN